MTELYRMRIADRRQVTLPQRLLNRLGIEIGDEIAIEMSENAQRVIGYKGIETSLLTPEIQRLLDEREKGPFKPTTVREVMRLASSGARKKGASASPVAAMPAKRPGRRLARIVGPTGAVTARSGAHRRLASHAEERLMAE